MVRLPGIKSDEEIVAEQIQAKLKVLEGIENRIRALLKKPEDLTAIKVLANRLSAHGSTSSVFYDIHKVDAELERIDESVAIMVTGKMP